MKILLHLLRALPTCHRRFAGKEGLDLTGFWYNPNIHPFTEYQQPPQLLAGVCGKKSGFPWSCRTVCP